MTAPAPTELLPCPHCEGTDIRFDRHPDYRSPTKEIWSMCCYQCGATFPNRYKKQLLVDAWNTRPLPRSAVQSGDALAAALYEAECYGIGATSDTNQRVILQAAKDLAALAPAQASPQLSEFQRRLDASCSPEQARESVRREREALANRDKPHPQPDGFINDYD